MSSSPSAQKFSFLKTISSSHALAFPILLALLTGAVTSFTAVLYIKLIDLFEKFYFGWFAASLHLRGPFAAIFIPAFGGLFAGIWLCKVVPQAKGSSVPEVLKAIIAGKSRIHPLVVPGKIIGTALSLGSGTAVGREGPIVQVGSAIGSNVGTFFRLSESRIRNLIACGAAAGIATVFNAPITGVMYSLEIILRDFGAKTLPTVAIAAVISSVICKFFLGSTPAFHTPSFGLQNPGELFYYFLLGILSGLTALFFNYSLHKTTQLFSRSKFPDWLKPAIGGLLIGVMGYFCAENLGTGFNIIEQVLQGGFGWKFLLLLVLSKILGSSISLGSNNPGGLFGPTLFIGAMLGGAMGHLLQHHAGFPVAPAGAYALAAMAAVFAGSAHAPMTAMFLIFELTDNYHMILPVMTAVVVSTSISQWLHRDSMDDIELKHQGLSIDMLEEGRTLGVLEVRDAMSRQFEIIPPELSIKQILDRAEKSRNLIVMKNKELLGVITWEQIQHEMLDEDFTIVNAADLAMPFMAYCYPEESLGEAGRIMMAHGVTHLPVVEASDIHKVVGIIKSDDVFSAYTKLASQRSDIDSKLDAVHSSEETLALRFSVSPTATVIGKSIKEVNLPESAVLTSLTRKNTSCIVRGNTVFLPKDKIWAVVEKKDLPAFKQWLADRKLKITP